MAYAQDGANTNSEKFWFKRSKNLNVSNLTKSKIKQTRKKGNKRASDNVELSNQDLKFSFSCNIL